MFVWTYIYWNTFIDCYTLIAKLIYTAINIYYIVKIIYIKYVRTYICVYIYVFISNKYAHGSLLRHVVVCYSHYRNRLKKPTSPQFFHTHLLDEGVNFKSVNYAISKHDRCHELATFQPHVRLYVCMYANAYTFEHPQALVRHMRQCACATTFKQFVVQVAFLSCRHLNLMT